jgi:Arc/MetJ-type ribon-helix-helix transcriptional regulator
MTTVAMRMPDELLDQVDALVATGRFRNRTSAFRAALEALLEDERRREIDRRYVEGYTAIPADPPDQLTEWLADQSVAEEPW